MATKKNTQKSTNPYTVRHRKWQKENADKARYYQYKSNSKTFIKNADLEGLKWATKVINKYSKSAK